MVNSKQKGKRGELEAVHYLKKKGYEARRSQQYKGTPESADVECNELPFHLEIKRVERLDVHKAYRKASDECKPPKIPLVMHRKNQDKDWLATLSMDDLLDLIEGLFAAVFVHENPPAALHHNVNKGIPFSQSHR